MLISLTVAGTERLIDWFQRISHGPTVNEVNQGPGVGKGRKGNLPELDQVRQDEGDRDRG